MNIKRLIFSALLLIPLLTRPCTEGLIIGEFTHDSRPIHWKLRMWTGTNRLIFWDNDTNNDGIPDTDQDGNGKPDTYAFLGIRSNTNEHPNYLNPMMGLNEAGFSIGITVVGNVVKGNTDPVMIYPLCHIRSFSEFFNFLKSCPGVYDERNATWTIKNNYGVMDAGGKAAEFEYHRSDKTTCKVRVYSATDPVRKNVKYQYGKNTNMYGIVCRANEFWSDAPTGEYVEGATAFASAGRFSNAMNNMAALKPGGVSILKLLQGDNPQAGNFAHMVLRRSVVSEPDSNCSTMIVQGVLEGENPLLAVFWAVMGHSDFSVALPVWILGVKNDTDKLPPHCTASANEKENFAWYADNLHTKEKSWQRVQELTLPFERKIFDEVENLLMPRWRNADWNNKKSVEAVGKQMNRYQNQTAADAFTLIRFLYRPHSEKLQMAGITYRIESAQVQALLCSNKPIASAKSIDGRKLVLNKPWLQYNKIQVNYGDGSLATESLQHTYAQAGPFLVSVSITTTLGIGISGWVWVDVL